MSFAINFHYTMVLWPCTNPDGGGGAEDRDPPPPPPPPWKITIKAIGSLAIQAQNPWKMTKLSNLASIQCLASIGLPAIWKVFCWRADDGEVFGSSLPSSTKKIVRVGTPLTKLSGSAHDDNVWAVTEITAIMNFLNFSNLNFHFFNSVF